MAEAPEHAKPALQDDLDKLRAGAARNRTVRQYNEALAQWKRGELKAALAGFEHVAATATDPDVAKAAAENARARARRALEKENRLIG